MSWHVTKTKDFNAWIHSHQWPEGHARGDVKAVGCGDRDKFMLVCMPGSHSFADWGWPDPGTYSEEIQNFGVDPKNLTDQEGQAAYESLVAEGDRQ